MKKTEKLDPDENFTHAKNRPCSTSGSVVTADFARKEITDARFLESSSDETVGLAKK